MKQQIGYTKENRHMDNGMDRNQCETQSSLNHASICRFYNSCGCRYGRYCRFVHAPHEHSVNDLVLKELNVIKSTINESNRMIVEQFKDMMKEKEQQHAKQEHRLQLQCDALKLEIERLKKALNKNKNKQQKQQQTAMQTKQRLKELHTENERLKKKQQLHNGNLRQQVDDLKEDNVKLQQRIDNLIEEKDKKPSHASDEDAADLDQQQQHVAISRNLGSDYSLSDQDKQSSDLEAAQEEQSQDLDLEQCDGDEQIDEVLHSNAAPKEHENENGSHCPQLHRCDICGQLGHTEFSECPEWQRKWLEFERAHNIAD